MKKEIEHWLDQKLHEFVIQENKTPQISDKRYLDRYVYMEVHEIFFVTFSSYLYDSIARLANSQGRYKLDQPIVWTLELVCRPEASKDKITWVVDHWLDRIIGGFITEFTIDITISYSKVEQHFFRGS